MLFTSEFYDIKRIESIRGTLNANTSTSVFIPTSMRIGVSGASFELFSPASHGTST